MRQVCGAETRSRVGEDGGPAAEGVDGKNCKRRVTVLRAAVDQHQPHANLAAAAAVGIRL